MSGHKVKAHLRLVSATAYHGTKIANDHGSSNTHEYIGDYSQHSFPIAWNNQQPPLVLLESAIHKSTRIQEREHRRSCSMLSIVPTGYAEFKEKIKVDYAANC